MNKKTYAKSLFLILALTMFAGCKGSSDYNETAPLSNNNINLIFVVSADLAYNEPGGINSDTANLTRQGLQRSIMMATYLKEDVLGGKKVTTIYALTPMTHLQTDNNYPDMAGIGSIKPFALLNQITLPYDTVIWIRLPHTLLPLPVENTPCTYDLQYPFSTSRTRGLNGVVIPAAINTNEKIYIIRHAEAHPDPTNHFEDGNFVGAGQWRALDLQNALNDKISTDYDTIWTVTIDDKGNVIVDNDLCEGINSATLPTEVPQF